MKISQSYGSGEIQVIPNTASASTISTTPLEAIAVIFRTVIILSGGIFLVLVLFGALSYLLNAGNEEGTTKAKRVITQALIGLLIVIFSYGIGVWILRVMGYSA